MGKVLSEIGDKERAFIASQKVFFVATAPLDPDHRVSLSPKSPGRACAVLDPHTVAYADLTGSGAETAAHVLQNGRMTLMFCNLEEGPPKILRLHGTAELIMAENVDAKLKACFPGTITSSRGFRAVYRLSVHRVSTSCGYSMPVMTFVKQRTMLEDVTCKILPHDILGLQIKNNSFSIDGLPSVALLQSQTPAVVPVAEDGFIHGKIAKNNGDGDAAVQAARLARLQNQQNGARKHGAWTTLVLVFVTGALSGMIVMWIAMSMFRESATIKAFGVEL